MTKSTITRERLEVLANAQYCKSNPGVWLLGLKEVNELARMALAALDSEPDRNPVLAYADSYRDMAKQGVESVPIWSVITDLERNIAPLYRHAQQPVVPASQKEPISFDEWSRKCALQITLCYPDFREKAKYIWDSARETQQPALVVPDELKEAAADFLTVLDEYPEQLVPINRDSAVVRALRAAMLAAAPQEVKP